MDGMLTYDQLSELTGIKKNTLYALVSQHRIPHVRIGRRLVRFARDEIESWLRSKHVMARDVWQDEEAAR